MHKYLTFSQIMVSVDQEAKEIGSGYTVDWTLQRRFGTQKGQTLRASTAMTVCT